MSDDEKKQGRLFGRAYDPTTGNDRDTAEPYHGEPPFQAHSSTSHAASREVAEDASALRARVWRFLWDRGDRGATDEEIITGTRLSPNTARPRRIELVAKGYARDSGTTRQTASGRYAVVWFACYTPIYGVELGENSCR